MDYCGFLPIKKSTLVAVFLTLASRHMVRSDYTVFADTSTPNPATILHNGDEILVANKVETAGFMGAPGWSFTAKR